MYYLGIRVSKRTHDALRKMQEDSTIPVSLNALVRHLLDQSLGFEKETNGKKRRR
jgi:hypothetical protein